jgi:hypothetical protein
LQFIDAVELPQHENSFVSVDGSTMTAYTMDHFDGDTLLRYDVARGWAPLPPLQLTMTLHSTQGADVADGAVWISTSDANNDVYRVDLQSGATTLVGSLGHAGAEGEGIDATALPSGQLHALVNDINHRRVELDHYDVTSRAASPAVVAAPITSGPRNVSGLVIVAAGAAFAIVLVLLARRPRGVR